MTATIVNEISRHCNCSLSTVDTFSTNILCSDSGDVVYRGGLGASTQLSIEVIQTVLKEWIAQTSMLIVNGSQLQVDHDCPLVLSSFDDPICDSTSADTPVPQDSSDNSIIPILVGVICGVIIGAVLITSAIVILVAKCRGKTDQIRYAIHLKNLTMQAFNSFYCAILFSLQARRKFTCIPVTQHNTNKVCKTQSTNQRRGHLL